MNEKINPYIISTIIISILFLSLITICIFRELDQRAKNREYQTTITELERTSTGLRNDNTGLRKKLTEIGNELDQVRANYTELEREHEKSVESLRGFNTISSQFRKTTQEFDQDIANLERLLSEFFSE